MLPLIDFKFIGLIVVLSRLLNLSASKEVLNGTNLKKKNKGRHNINLSATEEARYYFYEQSSKKHNKLETGIRD